MIVLDVHMPNVDGYKLVRDIKEVEELNTIPIIIITADETLEERFVALKVRHYFTKPYNTEHVLNRIDKILKGF